MNEQSVALSEQRNAFEQQLEAPFQVFRMSWVAYVRESWALVMRLLILGVVTLALINVVAWLTKAPPLEWLMHIAVGLALLWTAYSVALTRSIRLYTDETGVWMFSGVFPWQKGISGVKWKDISEATYTQGFLSWLLRSYPVRVGHRFTQGAELYIPNIHQGNLAVEHINGITTDISGRVTRTA